MTKNLYEILEINKTATEKEIKSAYRKLAKKYHPDVNSHDPTAEDKFKDVQNAYEILSDKNKKYQYDQFGTIPGQQNSNTPNGFSSSGYWNMTKNQNVQINTNIGIRMFITMEESLKPVIRKIQYLRSVFCADCNGTGGAKDSEQVTCNECNGNGVRIIQQTTGIGVVSVIQMSCNKCQQKGYINNKLCTTCYGTGVHSENQEREITIPVGSIGNRMIIDGGGNCSIPNQPVGKLVIEIFIQPHDKFEFDQYGNIHYLLLIDPVEAMIGNQLKVPTIDGSEINITINPQTNNDATITIPKRGLPTSETNRMDMKVKIKYVIPNITSEMKEILEKYLQIKTQGDNIK